MANSARFRTGARIHDLNAPMRSVSTSDYGTARRGPGRLGRRTVRRPSANLS